MALFSGNYNYLRDGANRALNRVVRDASDSANIEFRIYSPTTRTPAFEPAGTLISVPSIPFPGHGEFRVALGMPRRIREDLAGFAPDLVHVSAPDPLGNAASKWAGAHRIPVVASLHTRFETYFGFYGLGWIRGLVEGHLDRFYDRSDFILAPNRPIMAELAARYGAQRTRLWHRGVEHGDFSPARRDLAWRRSLGYADDAPIVLFFGRLVREKGIDMFAEAIGLLEREFPGLRPMVIGDGPERKRFEAMLPRGVFLGHLDGESLWRAVASADILFNPSVTEAFGNVVLEAMAAGLAIVAADAPSTRALIAPHENGILCPPNDPPAYAAALAALLADPPTRRGIALAAQRASLEFNWSDSVGNVLAVYAEAMAGR
ncbi:MAG: glycosyltransferase family 1 protein [Novosphingobium sp.]|nr:glycosyltransferase family 1 protein [Novosphingobium sp.]